MKKIKNAIFIIVIVIIILIFSIILVRPKQHNTNNIEINQENKKIIENNIIDDSPTPSTGLNQYKPDGIIKELTSEIDYFTVKNIVEKYFYECDKLKNPDIMLPRTGVSEMDLQKYISEQKAEMQSLSKKVLYNMLGKDYIKEFSITQDSLTNKFGIDYSYKIIMDGIKTCDQDDRISRFIVSGKIINTENNKYKEFKLLIAMDEANKAYNIYPQEYMKKHNIDNLKDGDNLSFKINDIKADKHNTYSISNNTVEELCIDYYDSLKNSLLYIPDTLYDILDSDYSKKRFGNKEVFYQYIKDNKELYETSKLVQYQVVERENIKEYICIDNYNNYYLFKTSKGILNYSIFLDDYTITTGNELAAYYKLKDSKKANYNLHKIIKMINTKDYDSFYKVLNIDFKKNNFNNLNTLKLYVKKFFYDINGIEIKETKEHKDYYSYKCKLINQRNTKETKNVTIIISKTKDTNFTMSFSFE